METILVAVLCISGGREVRHAGSSPASPALIEGCLLFALCGSARFFLPHAGYPASRPTGSGTAPDEYATPTSEPFQHDTVHVGVQLASDSDRADARRARTDDNDVIFHVRVQFRAIWAPLRAENGLDFR